MSSVVSSSQGPSESGTGGGSIPADWTLERGRDAYLRENHFSVAAYDAPWTDASIFSIPIKVPNTTLHKRAIRLHDLHHVATGYGTDMIGEAEISAWELRRGLSGLGFYTGSIVLSLAIGGVFLAPKRVWRAYRASGAGRSSLFQDPRPYDEVLDESVGALRARLGVPPGGVAEGPRGLHARALSARSEGAVKT